MSHTTPIPPPFDTELEKILDVVNESITPTLLPEHLEILRGPGFTKTLDELLETYDVDHRELVIPGPAGAPDLTLSVFSKPGHEVGPGFFYTHVGGMIFGDRFVGVEPVIEYVNRFDAVVVTVEYRLAPENPAPAALEDSYAALTWTAEHAAELGIDATRLFAIGGSAGAGLTAGITLLARDRRGPALAGQVIMYGMLDELNESVSARQIDGIGIWDRTSNETGWNFLLGERRHGASITGYESPAFASRLADLPPTYIEVGSAEVFRDEDVAYASTIWAAGGSAELHVWPGGYHLFELLAPDAELSLIARRTRGEWIRRQLEA